MEKEIKAVYEEWSFARYNTKVFVEFLNKTDSNYILNRPGLDSTKKHFNEMIDIQNAYISALQTKILSYENTLSNDEYSDASSYDAILMNMETSDEKMKNILETMTENDYVFSDGEKKSIVAHICALISHEMFHIGQLIGFCYAQNLEIPDEIREMWALS